MRKYFHTAEVEVRSRDDVQQHDICRVRIQRPQSECLAKRRGRVQQIWYLRGRATSYVHAKQQAQETTLQVKEKWLLQEELNIDREKFKRKFDIPIVVGLATSLLEWRTADLKQMKNDCST